MRGFPGSSFLPSCCTAWLWKWPVPGSGLPYTSFPLEFTTYWTSITTLLVTEISWGSRDNKTAQPLTLSQTRRIWPLYDLGKVSSCPPSFAGQVLWLLIFPSLENQFLSSPRQGISRRGEKCSAAAMPWWCLETGFFPLVFVVQNAFSCVWALKPPPDEMKSKGSQEFPWVQHEAWTTF